MIRNNLVLDVPPGIGLLSMAFESEGYCVVNGPDLLWGRDMRGWHPVKGTFEGVIGGPPCQIYSTLRLANPYCGLEHGDLITEWVRIVSEASPDWFLMENVRDAPLPQVVGYVVFSYLLNNRWFGAEQNRVRRFSFGTQGSQGLNLDVALFEHPNYETAVLAGHDDYISRRGWNAPARPLARLCELQGVSLNRFKDCPFTIHGLKYCIGNGVPLPMGRAVAKAVRKATLQ